MLFGYAIAVTTALIVVVIMGGVYYYRSLNVLEAAIKVNLISCVGGLHTNSTYFMD